ncbi:MAG: arginine deiminase family protein [Actinomycetota bacterium]
MNAYGTVRRIYVRPPHPQAFAAWQAYGWHADPDIDATVAEHAALVEILRARAGDVVVGTQPVPGDPDAVYAYDPTLVTDAGVIPLRPGKEGRRGEPAIVAAELGDAGCTILPPLSAPATAEGGDMVFLDARTLLVGLGYRTNTEAIEQLRPRLANQGVEILTYDLPHHRGPGECLHLMSFLSMLDADLAVVYLPMMPVRLVQVLAARGIGFVEVPDEEFPTMGPNVLALGPRRVLAVQGNPVTRERMEAAGVDVTTYVGAHISLNGDGGPTCLTRPLERS